MWLMASGIVDSLGIEMRCKLLLLLLLLIRSYNRRSLLKLWDVQGIFTWTRSLGRILVLRAATT
jgi:hypothetical protein